MDSKIEKAKITNEFVYGDEKVVCAYVNGNEINVESKGVTSTNARVNRYYAEKIFDISDNTNISLDMTRYNFGLHLYLMPPTEGTLTVRGGSLFEYVLDSNSPLVDESFVYALAINGQKEDVYILVNWEKNDGEVVDLSLGRTTVNNKTMTTINVNINDRIDGSNININYDSEMNYDDIVIK